MKKYIVTGGNGYLGYVLVNELIKRKLEPITVIALPNDNIDKLKNLNLNIEIGNILDKEFLRNVINEGDVVFHLAGIVDIGSAKNKIIYDVNVGGVKNIVDVCIEKNVEKLIYSSSVHTIDPLENGETMNEPNSFSIENLVGDYAKSKAMATEYVLNKANSNELNAVVIYPSGMIGPFDHAISNFGQVVLDYINRKLTAYVKGGYNFVDVRDVADGIIKAYYYGRQGEGYILSCETIDLKTLFTILNEKLGRKKLPNKLALWFVKMLVPFAELHYKIRKKKPIFSSYSLYTLNVNSNFSYEKAKKELGFNPRSLKESLSDMVDWFLVNKKDLINTKNYPKKFLKSNGILNNSI